MLLLPSHTYWKYCGWHWEQYFADRSPIIFDLREHNDSPELQKAAANLLALITAVTPPLELTEPLLLSLVDTLQNSPSWKIRLHVLPV